MTGQFWIGVGAGVLAALAGSFALGMLFAAVIHQSEMAEPRVWTDEDDLGFLELVHDLEQL